MRGWMIGAVAAGAGFLAGRMYPAFVGNAESALPRRGIPAVTPPRNMSAVAVPPAEELEALGPDGLGPPPPSRVELAPSPVSGESPSDGTRGLSNEELRDVLESLGSGWPSEIPEEAEGTGAKVGGVPHGEWQLYYPSTGKTDTGQFIFGRRFGTWIVTDGQGNVIQKRPYVDGKVSGSYEWVDPETGSWLSTQYVNGEPVH